MKRFGRRRFLGASVAAWCVGCSSDGDTPTLGPTLADPPDDAVGPSRFGRPVVVGGLDEVLAATSASPLYVPEARAWLVGVGPDDAAAVAAGGADELQPGLEHGLLALSQKCPHLGCRVPYCESSGWFECPCHAALFTRTGEHRSGPGSRGMDALAIAVDGGIVSIDAVGIVAGSPIGTVVVEQPPQGPHCVGDTDDAGSADR